MKCYCLNFNKLSIDLATEAKDICTDITIDNFSSVPMEIFFQTIDKQIEGIKERATGKNKYFYFEFNVNVKEGVKDEDAEFITNSILTSFYNLNVIKPTTQYPEREYHFSFPAALKDYVFLNMHQFKGYTNYMLNWEKFNVVININDSYHYGLLDTATLKQLKKGELPHGKQN